MIWTEAEDAVLMRMTEAGSSAPAIAAKLGTTRDAILGRRKRIGLTAHAPKSWTPEKVAILEKMCRAGFSAGQIAPKVGMSRHATLGKAQRMKLPLQHPAGRPPGTQQRQSKPMRIPTQAHRLPPASIEGMPSPPVSLNVSLLDLTADACRWPTSGEGAAMLSCGHRKVAGFVYCEHHARIAFQPMAPSRRKLEAMATAFR